MESRFQKETNFKLTTLICLAPPPLPCCYVTLHSQTSLFSDLSKSLIKHMYKSSICVGDQRHTTFLSESYVFSFGPGTTTTTNKMSSGKFSHVVDLAFLLIVGLASALLGLVIPPYRRGFFCNDESIKYPYITNETFPTWALLLVSVVLPVVTVSNCINEL